MLAYYWQEEHPAVKKTEWWDSGVVICLGQVADLRMAQLMPLPLTISCSRKSRLQIQIFFTDILFAHLRPYSQIVDNIQ